MDFALNDEEKRMLLRAARAAVEERFAQKRFLPGMLSQALRAPCGAFVTLTRAGELRGCIGYVSSDRPLFSTVVDAAAAAAFQDSRFTPIGEEELAEIRIEISVLSPLTKIHDVQEIVVGKHGILMSRGHLSGLLLPQVATEYGWDRETFLENTCRKAGLAGGCWRESDVSIETFTAEIFADELPPA